MTKRRQRKRRILGRWSIQRFSRLLDLYKKLWPDSSTSFLLWTPLRIAVQKSSCKLLTWSVRKGPCGGQWEVSAICWQVAWRTLSTLSVITKLWTLNFPLLLPFILLPIMTIITKNTLMEQCFHCPFHAPFCSHRLCYFFLLLCIYWLKHGIEYRSLCFVVLFESASKYQTFEPGLESITMDFPIS